MGAGTILAKASFSRVVRGAVYFVRAPVPDSQDMAAYDIAFYCIVQIQEDFGADQLGNTHIIVDAYYADSSTAVSDIDIHMAIWFHSVVHFPCVL